jgi:tetratricopeptide (TPR) repeat protein
VRSQLRTLSKLNAEKVARHLVAAGRLVDEDPAAALQHARAARALGARVAVVREAVGETAYAAGEWTEAIAELRTARRMTGDDSALPMIADAERALGRADRALKIAQSEEAQALEPAERAEMRIVEAGARHDLGQLDAALLTLQDSGLDRTSTQPWSARVWYAYADLLLAAGREDEAREWFVAAAAADQDGSTDADERLLQLDGIEVLTDEDDEDEAANGDADVIDLADESADPDENAADADPNENDAAAAADLADDLAHESDEDEEDADAIDLADESDEHEDGAGADAIDLADESDEDEDTADEDTSDAVASGNGESVTGPSDASDLGADADRADTVAPGYDAAGSIDAAGAVGSDEVEPADETGTDGQSTDEEPVAGGVGGDADDADEAELDEAEDVGIASEEDTTSEKDTTSEDDTTDPAGTPGAPTPGNPIVLTFSDQSESGSSE